MVIFHSCVSLPEGTHRKSNVTIENPPILDENGIFMGMPHFQTQTHPYNHIAGCISQLIPIVSPSFFAHQEVVDYWWPMSPDIVLLASYMQYASTSN